MEGAWRRVAVVLLAVLCGVVYGQTPPEPFLEEPSVDGYAHIEYSSGRWRYDILPLDGQGGVRRQVELSDVDERIIGGSLVQSPSALPYMATLNVAEDDGNLIFFCSAHLVVLQEQVALTSAHCIFPGNDYVICAGSVDASHPGKCVKASKITLHPEFTLMDISSPDVAIVELERPLEGPNIDTIRLRYDASAASHVFMAGFDVSLTDSTSLQLRQAQTDVLRGDCPVLNMLSGQFPQISSRDYLLCTSGMENGNPVQACFLDSGSPLIARVNGVDYAIGIFSFSNCGMGESVYDLYGAPAIKNNFLQSSDRLFNARSQSFCF